MDLDWQLESLQGQELSQVRTLGPKGKKLVLKEEQGSVLHLTQAWEGIVKLRGWRACPAHVLAPSLPMAPYVLQTCPPMACYPFLGI